MITSTPKPWKNSRQMQRNLSIHKKDFHGRHAGASLTGFVRSSSPLVNELILDRIPMETKVEAGVQSSGVKISSQNNVPDATGGARITFHENSSTTFEECTDLAQLQVQYFELVQRSIRNKQQMQQKIERVQDKAQEYVNAVKQFNNDILKLL